MYLPRDLGERGISHLSSGRECAIIRSMKDESIDKNLTLTLCRVEVTGKAEVDIDIISSFRSFSLRDLVNLLDRNNTLFRENGIYYNQISDINLYKEILKEIRSRSDIE